MRTAPLVALLCALALVLAACGGDDGSGGSEETASDGSELPDDVAATVDGEEIPASEIDGQVDAVLETAGDQIPEEQAEQVKTRLRTQVLQQTITGIVAIDAAEELGVPVEDSDIEEAREAAAEQQGGEEELQKVIDESGMTDDQIEERLRTQAAMENIQDALAEEADAEGEADGEAEGDPEAEETSEADAQAEAASTEGNGEGAPEEGAGGEAAPEEGAGGESAPQEGAGGESAPQEGEAPPAPQGGPEPGSPEALAQEFLTEQLQEADIVVNPDYGRWDSEQGRLLPPEGATPQMPAPQQGGGQQGGGQQGGAQQGGGQQGAGQ